MAVTGDRWIPTMGPSRTFVPTALGEALALGRAMVPPDGTRYDYEYLAADLFSDEITASLPLRDVSYGWARNKPGSFSATLPIPAAPVVEHFLNSTRPGQTAIYVMRNGHPVWGGILWKRSLGSKDREIKLEADTFDSYMYHRILDQDIFFYKDDTPVDPAKRFPGTEQTDIFRFLWGHMSGTLESDPAWSGRVDNAIPRSPFANIGVVLDPYLTDTVKRGRYFKKWDFKTYGEHIEGLCELTNGFDWCSMIGVAPADRMTPSGIERIISLGYPKFGRPQSETGFIWEYPGNVLSYTWDVDVDKANTRVFIQGKGEGDLKTYSEDINTKALNLGFPLLDGTYTHSTVYDIGTLHAHGGKYLRAYEPPIGNFSLEFHQSLQPVFWATGDDYYFIGDEIALRIDDEIFNQSSVRPEDMMLRVEGITVSPNDEGLEEVKPEISIISRDPAIPPTEEVEDDLVPEGWPGPAIQPEPGGEITIQMPDGSLRNVRTRSLAGPRWARGKTLTYDPDAPPGDVIGNGRIESIP